MNKEKKLYKHRMTFKEKKMEKISGFYVPKKMKDFLIFSVKEGYFPNVSESARFFLQLGLRNFLGPVNYNPFNSLLTELKELTMYREKMERLTRAGKESKAKKNKQKLEILINIDVDKEMIDWERVIKKANRLFPDYIFILQFKCRGPLVSIDSENINEEIKEEILAYFYNPEIFNLG